MVHEPLAECVTDVLFDIVCDQSLNRRMATRKLLVLHNKETKKKVDDAICPPIAYEYKLNPWCKDARENSGKKVIDRKQYFQSHKVKIVSLLFVILLRN